MLLAPFTFFVIHFWPFNRSSGLFVRVTTTQTISDAFKEGKKAFWGANIKLSTPNKPLVFVNCVLLR